MLCAYENTFAEDAGHLKAIQVNVIYPFNASCKSEFTIQNIGNSNSNLGGQQIDVVFHIFLTE